MIYVNSNGMYGNGAYEKPEYKTVYDLVQEMDRLGIWASVTAHAEGRDLSPLYGNRKLMEDIKKCDFQNRIIPSFAISPAMLYAPEEFEYMLSHLKSYEVSFVSVYPKTNRHGIREIERVLSRISPYSPVVLINAEEMQKGDYTELSTLANRYSKLHFIIQNVMWWDFSATADLMWRCKNIYIDTARLHFRGAICSLVKALGKGRTVFGLGSISNGGASIASLTYAELDDIEKKKIAGLNILSLMNNQEKAAEIILSAVEPKPKVNNSYWEPFIQGNGIQDTLVIDAHTHIGPMARGWYMPNADIDLQLADLEADMQKFSIDLMVSAPEPGLFGNPLKGSMLIEKKVKNRGNRFKGYLPFNPHYEDILTVENIGKLLNNKYFIGFKVLPEYWRIGIDNPVYNPVWAYADKHRLPILIHTWENTEGTPEMIEPLAKKYSNAIFILGHSGGTTKGREQAIKAANRYNNIYLEFCGSFTAKQRWEDTVKRVDSNRVLFGTDTYPHDIAWELGRLLSCDIDDDTLRLILGENMKQVLKLSTI